MVYNNYMWGDVIRSLNAAIEWRIIAFVITNIFFWITTGEFWTAAGLAVSLQVTLFIAYIIWHLYRNELHVPLVPPLILKHVKAFLPRWK